MLYGKITQALITDETPEVGKTLRGRICRELHGCNPEMVTSKVTEIEGSSVRTYTGGVYHLVTTKAFKKNAKETTCGLR